MKTTLSKRMGLAFAALLGAIGVSLLIPAVARTAVPNPAPAGINLGGLHLTPTSGNGGETPSFKADTACPAGTNLANVNTIDLAGVEQTISNNVTGVLAVKPGFGTTFNTTMATVQSLAGNGGQESFLFMVDCRTGADHGTYTDAVQVDFGADGSWVVHGTTPVPPTSSATPTASAPPSNGASPEASTTQTATPGPSDPISPTPASSSGNLPVTGGAIATIAGVAVALIGVGVGLRYAARRRDSESSA
ncbi:hypothetical protein ACPPVO_05695 [Dactylosporangium sp. McL0621]|uniref:hypothetical protein n=1 Tax=Dactylosporangium sp. McL0621 TaxID=3415678 RepID=UPI003CE6BAAC